MNALLPQLSILADFSILFEEFLLTFGGFSIILSQQAPNQT
jgi:hypothetical protein